MPRTGAFLDTNLLVLLVVGGVDRASISRHRRTRAFVPEDYDRLLDAIETLGAIFVTPNTLTETSNLLRDSRDPRFADRLRALIGHGTEIVVDSKAAARNEKFPRLGLTDSVLLEAISPQTPLVTVDLELYAAALAKGGEAAFNFTHYRSP